MKAEEKEGEEIWKEEEEERFVLPRGKEKKESLEVTGKRRRRTWRRRQEGETGALLEG